MSQETGPTIGEISPQEFTDVAAPTVRPMTLLDVREDWETRAGTRSLASGAHSHGPHRGAAE